MDDRFIANIVNTVRDIAINFHTTEQLRARIAHVLVPQLKRIAELEARDAFRIGQADEIASLKQQVAELEVRKFAKFANDECWIWQGDGQDNLESLVCPVVIAPTALFRLADMAAVGEALMESIRIYADEGWHPADSPVEIVGDLHNDREELRDQLSAARREATEAKGLNASVDKLINDVIQLLTMRGDWGKAVEMLLNRPRCDQQVSTLGAAIEQARREEREKFIAQLGDMADNARDNGYPLAVEALQEAIELLAETPCESATKETGDAIDTAIAEFWKGGV